jgi:hypothetical protein
MVLSPVANEASFLRHGLANRRDGAFLAQPPEWRNELLTL